MSAKLTLDNIGEKIYVCMYFIKLKCSSKKSRKKAFFWINKISYT